MTQLHTRKKIKKHERLYLFEIYNYTCKICNKRFNKPQGYDGTVTVGNDGDWLEIDHIIPLSKGGTDNLDNKQVLCKRCNCKKYNKYERVD